MTDPNDIAFRDAIDELAEEALSRQWDQTVTLEEAREHVDAATIAGWYRKDTATYSSAHQALSEATERMTDAEIHGLVHALAGGDHCAAGTILGRVLADHVAHTLRDRAQYKADCYEPSDADIERYYSRDPVQDAYDNDLTRRMP
jgi:hypothetical protein